jgi:hypothetical protein
MHDNAQLHTAAHTCVLLEQFGWKIFEHPPYSPDFAPTSRMFWVARVWGDTVQDWLKGLVVSFYDEGIQKPVS